MRLIQRVSIWILVALVVLPAWNAASLADHLSPPTGPVVLTIDGAIGHTTEAGMAQFDAAGLEALGLTAVETSNPWADGVIRYEGVLARTLLEAVGAKGDKVIAAALNDYIAEIPIADFLSHDVILAFKANGEYLPVRDKGPVFIVYPFDAARELRNERYYERSVWQLTRLTVE